MKLYNAAKPPPAGPTESDDEAVLSEAEWRKLDPANRPSGYRDAAGVVRWHAMRGLTIPAMQIFKLVPAESVKESALYFRKRSGLSRPKAEAAMLTALAGDLDEYTRIVNYGPDDIDRWWRETTLTPEGYEALTAFRREYDKPRLFG